MNVNDDGPAFERLYKCSTAVRLWFLQNDQQLNADKSEVVILGISPQLRLAANIREVDDAGNKLFARRAFSVAVPHTWNSVPSDIRSCRAVDTFKPHIKTHVFRESLNLMPPAPLYLRTLWRYRNVIIIF